MWLVGLIIIMVIGASLMKNDNLIALSLGSIMSGISGMMIIICVGAIVLSIF